ncbi:MAG: branched-chain amino acid ABC transporter permease [Firmicutes bacterium]|nr:branched-chain amino acid ABC transporter permease [Bacillota bacterium]
MKNFSSMIKQSRPYSDYIIFGLLLCTIPFLVDLGIFRFGWLTIVVFVLVYAIAGLGLNLLIGYGGLVSLGTAGFMGLGAYLTAFFTQNWGWDFLPSLVVTVIITSLLGILVGILSLRVEGFFLAMATLAISEIFREVFIEFADFTNSHSGRRAGFPEFFGFSLNRNQTYWLIVFFLIIAMIVAYNFANSRTGRALSAMRGSEAAATAMGVNILKYRIIAFATSTAFAGLSGVLYMHFFRFTNPNVWTFVLSLMLFASVVIGGVRSIAGTVVGAFVVFGAPDLILANLPVIGNINGMPFVFTGVLIIIVVLYYPAGVVYIWQDIKKLAQKLRGGAL